MPLQLPEYLKLRKEYIKSVNSLLDNCEDVELKKAIKYCWKLAFIKFCSNKENEE